MSKKHLGAVILYLSAIVLPTALLAWRYGFATHVDLTNSSEALAQLLTMGGGVICGVLFSLLGNSLLGSETENLFRFTTRVLSELTQQQRASNHKNRPALT